MKSRLDDGPMAGPAVVSADLNASEADAAVLHLRRQWDAGTPPRLEDLWKQHSRRGDLDVLAALIKADIQERFARGETAEVASYLAQFEPLKAVRERVVSLVYEEFCLREEAGEPLDPERFCDRYDPWRASLLAQLRYHFLLSRAIGALPRPRRLPAPGERFHSFRLGPVLGQGGSARVFLANDEVLGDRQVALKVSTDRGKEPAIQGRLDHDHIVPVLSVTDDPETGLRGLCMPYRAGLSLDEVIRRVDPASRPEGAWVLREALRPLDKTDEPDEPEGAGWRGFPAHGSYPDGVAWVGSVVAGALAYAHGQGVLHRDVKPANVLLTVREGPQLLDFNLSHSPHAADRAEAAQRGGTLPYMAPEQLLAFLNPEGWGDVGEAADIYAVGLLLREFLTGQRPDSPPESAPLPRAIRELLDRRVRGFVPTRSLNPEVPHGLDAIVTRCLAYRAEDRYRSADVLADDLRRYLDRRPLRGAVNPSRRERLANWAHRAKVGRVAMAVVPLTAMAAALWFLARREPGPVNARAYTIASSQQVSAERFDDAMTQADLAIRSDPNFYKGYWARALAHAKKKEHDLALRDFDLAVKLAKGAKSEASDDDTARLLADRGALLYARGKKVEAEADFREGLRLSNSSYTVLAGLGQVDEGKNKTEPARDYLTRAIALASEARPVPDQLLLKCYRLRAMTYVRDARMAQGMKQVDAARTLFDSARLDVEKAEAHGQRLNLTSEDSAALGIVAVMAHVGVGDIEAAREDFAKAQPAWMAARDALETVRATGLQPNWVEKYDEELARRFRLAEQH